MKNNDRIIIRIHLPSWLPSWDSWAAGLFMVSMAFVIGLIIAEPVSRLIEWWLK